MAFHSHIFWELSPATASNKMICTLQEREMPTDLMLCDHEASSWSKATAGPTAAVLAADKNSHHGNLDSQHS
jgi:hypothetical protein